MVLIIEDDLAIRSGLEYFLKEEGFNVITKENGISGIECINNDIELVLLDINLPDIDGIEKISCNRGTILQTTETTAIYVIPMQIIYIEEY